MIYTRCPLVLDGDDHEDVRRASPDFPAEGYDEMLGQDPGSDVPWHWHEELEAIVVSGGALRMLVPGRSLLLGIGTAVFVNRNVLHACKGEPTCRIRSVTFGAELVSGGGAYAITRRYLSPIVGNEAHPVVVLKEQAADGESCGDCVEAAVQAFERAGRGFEIDVRYALSKFMLHVIETSGEEAEGDHPRAAAGRIEAMCRYVEDHLSEDIGVSDMAHAAGIGEREALRCFRSELGETPSSYLAKQRLEHAARILVQNPTEAISKVAASVGMRSASNFSYRFRECFGCTPREWRLRAGNGSRA